MKPAFESCQWSPSSYNAQATCAVVVMEKKKKDHVLIDLIFIGPNIQSAMLP
jgi:hypothetical protein